MPRLDSGAWKSVATGGNLAASPQLQALCQRAERGDIEDIQRLTKWSALLEHEAQLLRRRSRKQQHDFNTLLEIVGQTSAKSLDLGAMETYILRTVSGHFATPKLLIMRRMNIEDNSLICSCAQGMPKPAFALPADSTICQVALDRRTCFSIRELADRPTEVQALLNLGVDLVVPLVQEVEGPCPVLEGMLLLGPRMVGLYNDEAIEFLQTLAKVLAICLRNETLYRRSIIDDLTGVASRGHFDARLSQEINRIATYGHRNMGLLMLDVDDFKLFNDRHGHQTGDRVLQELARLLVRQVRNVDLVSRYGGEEFAIILLEIDRAKVLEVAERLCESVAQMEVLSAQGEKLGVTVSIGVACFPEDALEKSTLIEMADEAMYQSKALGKNRVTATEPGSGKKRSAPGLRPIGSALLPAIEEPGSVFLPAIDAPSSVLLQAINAPGQVPSASHQTPPARHKPPTSVVGLLTPELMAIREQRLELTANDTPGNLLAPPPPGQAERRGTLPRVPPPPAPDPDET